MTTRLVLLGCCISVIFLATPSPGQVSSVTVRCENLGPSEYLQALRDDNWTVDEFATEMVRRYSTQQVIPGRAGEIITFEIVTAGALGFKKEATYDEICERAEKQGFRLCNPVDAVDWCMAYDRNNITGQSLIISMKPIKCRDGNEYVLLCKCRNKTQRVLLGRILHPNAAENKFLPAVKFVFKLKPPGNK